MSTITSQDETIGTSRWGDIMQRFSEHLSAARGLTGLTVRNYLADIRPLRDYMEMRGVFALQSLNRTFLREYLGWLGETGYARNSIVRKLSTLRTFLNWCVRQGFIASNPLPRRGSMKPQKRLPAVISQEQAQRLLDAPDITTFAGLRDRALLELIYGAGLRVSEVSSLDVADADLVTREIKVMGKGSRERVVLIDGTARDMLALYLKNGRPKYAGGRSARALFLSRFGRRLGPRSIQQRVRAYSQLASLPKGVHPHTLRHSFATHMLENDMDLRVVQHLLGHETPATTQIYTQVSNAELRRVYMAAHPRAS